MNLIQPILKQALQKPHVIAISDGSEQRTYAQLMKLIQQVASRLQYGGHAKRNIAILSENRIEFAELFLGAIYAGCVPVLLDPKWKLDELDRVIQQCEPGLIIGERRFAADIAVRHQDIPQLFFDEIEKADSYVSWRDSFQADAEVEDNPEILFIGYTSGTTGTPKGYIRTHLSWLRSCQTTEKAFKLDRIEHILAPGPLVHSLSLFALIQSLYSGSTFHMLPEFDAGKVLDLCSRVPELVLFVVPTMINAIIRLAVTSTAKVPIQALISSGGMWSDSLKRKCREVLGGTRLYEYYGSSEASFISYLEVTGEEKPGSLGKPFDGVQLSIRDELFQEVPLGSVGQLYIRSEMIFEGYHQLPEETANAFRDGWLCTGDYMSLDQDLNLHLAGRSQNMIKSGGLKVFPEEVEAVLLRIPAVQEVMVYGKPDDGWEEKVTALIQWRGEQRLSLREIRNFCRTYLASYKAPKELVTVERFIYTSSGKIARHFMKDYVREVVK